MHELERHNLILLSVQQRPVLTVPELCELTGASEATIRRDIISLDQEQKLRRVRGGVEAIHPPPFIGLAGRNFSINEHIRVQYKKAIAKKACELCQNGEDIIINGGTTTYHMAHHLISKQLQILTNSFPIAESLIHFSNNVILLAGGTFYRDKNIIISPYENDVSSNFYAHKMFMGAQGLGPMGLMEKDPLIIKAEMQLMRQADELIVLADSSKFDQKSSLLLCPLERIKTIITDDEISDTSATLIENADVELIVVSVDTSETKDIPSKDKNVTIGSDL